MARRPRGDAGCLGLFGWGSVACGRPQWVQVSHSSIRGDSSRACIFNTTTSHGEDGQRDQHLWLPWSPPGALGTGKGGGQQGGVDKTAWVLALHPWWGG